MYLPTILLPLATLPLSFALPHPTPNSVKTTRDAPTLLSQIDTISSSVSDLTTAVNKFDGSLLGLLPQSLKVLTASTKVDAATVKATKIAESSEPFTEAESQEIVSQLAGLIEPIQASLDALVAKQPLFEKALQSPIVLLTLNTLKKHTDEFIDAVTAKVTADAGGLLGLGKGVIDQAFDDAIAAYQ